MDVDEPLIRRVLAERVKLLAYIRSIVRRHDLAEDVFQDLCVLVVQKRHEIRDEGHLAGWLRTSARQLAMNAARKRCNQNLLLGDSIHDLMEPHWRRLDASSSSAAEALEVCVEALPSKSRQLVQIRYVEGLGFEDIARRLSRPVSSLYVSLSRIHKKLAECVQRRLSLAERGHA
jgi:RNA polymerase sigma-70 factor (ECF subfamily)